MLEKLDPKKVHEASADKMINMGNTELELAEELNINYTHNDLDKQLMVLDIGAPVSLAGIPWVKQYLQEFGLTIEEMNSVPCTYCE